MINSVEYQNVKIEEEVSITKLCYNEGSVIYFDKNDYLTK